MSKKYFLSTFLLLSFVFSPYYKLYSQENESEDLPGTAFYLEMGGKFFSSLNVDFGINESNRFSLDVSSVYGDIVHSVMYYHLGGKRSRFELGCCIGYVIILTEEIEHEEFKDITFHSVIGYRYQKRME